MDVQNGCTYCVRMGMHPAGPGDGAKRSGGMESRPSGNWSTVEGPVTTSSRANLVPPYRQLDREGWHLILEVDAHDDVSGCDSLASKGGDSTGTRGNTYWVWNVCTIPVSLPHEPHSL